MFRLGYMFSDIIKNVLNIYNISYNKNIL